MLTVSIGYSDASTEFGTALGWSADSLFLYSGSMRSPLSAYRALFADKTFFRLFLPVAIPIALQNLVSSLTSLGANLLVGQLGDQAVAGVSLAGQVQFLMILAAFGIGSGAAIFTSQYWGKGESSGVARTQGVSLTLSLAVGLLFGAAAGLVPEALLGLFTPDQGVIAQGAMYLRSAAWSFPLTALGMSYSLVLRSIGDTKTPLRFALVALVVQIAVALPLIFGWGPFPALGVAGAGLALVISRLVEGVGIVITVQVTQAPNAGWRRLFAFDAAFLGRYLKVALPVMVNEVLWSTGISAVKAIYGWMGGQELAALAVVETFSQLVFIVFFGTGNGAAVIIGQAIGRGDLVGARRMAGNVALFAPLMGVMVAIPLALAAPFLPLLFHISPEVRTLATHLIWVVCVLLPGRAFYHDMIVGVLRGGGDTNFSLYMDQSGIWLWALPLGWTMAFVFHWPFLLVYFLVSLEEPLKALLALWRLHTGRFIKEVTKR
jgi:putative MATE family efflux protein